MKFIKQKLKRCKDCICYRELGTLHYCVKTKKFIKDGIETDKNNLPLICFKKQKADKYIEKIVVYDRVTDSDIDMHIPKV